MPRKIVPPTTRFVWDANAGQYRDATGRFVPRLKIRQSLDRAIKAGAGRVTKLATQLQDGKISIAYWQEQTAAELKNMHLYSAGAARGGWHAMTQADYGRVGAQLRDQYSRLHDFADGIESGDVALDGRFLRRAEMYANAPRMTYEAQAMATAEDAGYTEYQNILHPADHCAGCIEAADAGWVPIGDLIPIGDRDCMVNDKCTYDYR